MNIGTLYRPFVGGLVFLALCYGGNREHNELLSVHDLRRRQLRTLPLADWYRRQHAPWYAALLWNYWYDAPLELAVEGRRRVDGAMHQQRLCHWNGEPGKEMDDAKRARHNVRAQATLRVTLENADCLPERREKLIGELPAWLDEMRRCSRVHHSRASMKQFLRAWNDAPPEYVALLLSTTDWDQLRRRQADRVALRYVEESAVIRLRYRAGFPVYAVWHTTTVTE